jgi:2-polyprenyl-3-methyl-5-hydroxy-6-metoxy-1,4-benzoquinol methylase
MPEGVYNFARCRRCSTLYVDSSVTDEYLSAIYSGESAEWAREATGIDQEERIALRLPEFQRHWNRLKQVRAPRSGDRLLDVGCQTGDFGALAQQDGVQPNGIELSESYAEVCRRRWGSAAHVHGGAVNEAPFAPGQFHYITSFETLEHTCDPIGVLQRLRSWLAADGALALSVPSSDFFHFKFWLLRKSPLSPVARKYFEHRSTWYKAQVLPHTHIYNFSLASARTLLERAGFKPVRVELTGWHGRLRTVGSAVGRVLQTVSGSRLGLAPSVFAVARRAEP